MLTICTLKYQIVWFQKTKQIKKDRKAANYFTHSPVCYSARHAFRVRNWDYNPCAGDIDYPSILHEFDKNNGNGAASAPSGMNVEDKSLDAGPDAMVIRGIPAPPSFPPTLFGKKQFMVWRSISKRHYNNHLFIPANSF